VGGTTGALLTGNCLSPSFFSAIPLSVHKPLCRVTTAPSL
jgi:hypothetical protein